MTVQIVAARRAFTGKPARRIIGRCALGAIGLGAISISAFGADLPAGSFQSITSPSQVTRADHWPITAQSSAQLDTKLDHLAAHVRIVDQLYEELMRWTPPCSAASTDGSAAGRC
jgi:hypothetical protein